MVFEPTTNSPAGSRDTGIPPKVTPGAPEDRVEPATSTPFGAAVTASPATVVMDGVVSSAGSETVLLPAMRAMKPSDMGVPDTVIGGVPGVRVVPATEMPLESRWTASPAIVVTWPAIVRSEYRRIAIVLVPITRADAPWDTRVPDTKIGGKSAVRIIPAIKMPSERG